MHVFDTETLAERQAFRAHDGPITALAWHPARPILATASADLTIKLWNLDTGRRLETLRGPTAAPRVLNFSPSGQRLACASEDRMVRIWEPKPLNNALLDAPATDGWEDLLAKLKADEVKANGNGWTLSGGVLVSSDKKFAAIPLAGNYARSSYRVRVTMRNLKDGKNFAVILPVGDQQVAFHLDGHLVEGFRSGLALVDGKPVNESPGVLREQEIKDTEPHELEITVRLSARTSQIEVTLDSQQLYEWSGSTSSLSHGGSWPQLPQPALHLGASFADWVVSAVKVKRLAK